MNVPFKRGQYVRLCDREGKYSHFLSGRKAMNAIAMHDGVTGISELVSLVDVETAKPFKAPASCIFYVYQHKPTPNG